MSSAPSPRGRGTARQLGLVPEPCPELEAKPPGRAPLPMEAIERMAALCMRDPEDEEDEDEEDEEDEDLMAELQEVLGGEDGGAPTPEPPRKAAPPGGSGLEVMLAARASLYRAAAGSAREAGDGARLRRYERGLKTLEALLAAVRQGQDIDEDQIPPPVALGGGTPKPPPASAAPPDLPKTPEDPPTSPGSPAEGNPAAPPGGAGAEAVPRGRPQDYRAAALSAKRRGDLELAAKCLRAAKSLEALLAAGGGPPVALSSGTTPPPPEQPPEEPPAPSPAPPAADAPPPPRDVLEALQQRMERYRGAAAQAKAKGDDRKARMHERIVKQYQEAIRAHRAGKAVDLSELPVPPGFPPLQGAEPPGGGQSLAGVLEAARRLAADEEEEDEEEAKKPPPPRAAAPQPKPAPAPPRASSAAPPPAANPSRAAKADPKNATRAQQQLAFLEGRRRQLAQAALRAKRAGDVEGAKLLLRRAKGLGPLLEASRRGLPVDIAQVPEAPVSEEDFALPQLRGPRGPPEALRQYRELAGLLRQQHEMCVEHSRQFARLGNITEITKFERLAESCRQSMETLKRAHAGGLPPPRHRYEQRTFSTVKIFPELSSSDLVLCVVRGINLPAPPGVAPNDLDAFVRFEFPYPTADEAQKDKTAVVKNTDCPEFGERFKLHINRAHRGLRRVLQAKGIRFEVAHKGGLFKPDRVLGTAQLKLEALETSCELREILELLDGRRPTGGKLEVVVRLRDPLGPPQLEARTERWLVVEPVAVPKPAPAAVPGKDANNGKPPPALPSLNLLAFDREKLERKVQAYRQAQRPVPAELQEQQQELARRGQRLLAQLQRGGPAFRKEYVAQLERYLQLYTETARRLGTEGNREAAKEALYKRNLVESELQKLRR